ncbi:MAG: corrinoid protein [Candidatus Promineifilaceae bacterium]|nr:corrinoid protein [Candidatus Promineifilaceae bacterium]
MFEELHGFVINGDGDDVGSYVQGALEQGVDPSKILNEGLILPMREVGDRFESGEFFVPEMLIAARAMEAGLDILRPYLLESGVEPVGTAVIGTVRGDLHDIGKNLVGMMLEGAGFKVVDLGTDVSPQQFVDTVLEIKPQILGMSALLTTTMMAMKDTVEAISKLSIRDQVKILVGGAPVTQEFADEIGADGFARDAAAASRLAGRLVAQPV